MNKKIELNNLLFHKNHNLHIGYPNAIALLRAQSFLFIPRMQPLAMQQSPCTHSFVKRQ